MKKITLSMAIAMLFALASCQKENPSKQLTAATPETVIKQKVNVASPAYSYVDLVLQPRQAGENFDTYTASFGLALIKVYGTPAWNSSAYPNLVNGVPTAGASVGAAPGYNANITMGASAIGEDIFTVSVGVLGSFNSSAFQADLSRYRDDKNAYEKDPSGKPNPLIYDYVKGSYTTQSNVVNTIGKLIRVTTGSHLGYCHG